MSLRLSRPSQVKHIDLFSGIGGFALAAQNVWGADYQPLLFCDSEDYCQRVLEKHWPDAPIYGDVRTLTRERYINDFGDNGRADLLTGGFPCQPFSVAGRRRGADDDRFLWPDMFRIIREFFPRWVIAENVRGLLSQGRGLAFEQVCSDLEALAYDVRSFVIPAAGVGAPHRRDRIWIIANADGHKHRGRRRPSSEANAISEINRKEICARRTGGTSEDVANTGTSNDFWRSSTGIPHSRRLEADKQERQRSRREPPRRNEIDWRQRWLEVATRLCRVDDGIPGRMDRTPRLQALGNAIVPQVAEEIMKAIRRTEACDEMTHALSSELLGQE